MKKTLKLSDIRIDGDTQARAGLDQTTVTEYSELMKDGAKFPALIVYFDGTDNWLADGFHRYFANKANGALEIECDIKEGTQRDAQFYAMGANGARGLKLRPEDIKKIVMILFQDEEWGEMSNSAIAKHVGVSAMTVGRYRRQWEETQEIDQEEAGDDEEIAEVTYTNKHGQKAKMNVTKAKEKKPREMAYQDEPTERPMTMEERLSDKLLELEDQLKETIEENEKLKDAVALGQYDASDIEKMDVEQTIKELREEIRVKDIEIRSLRESRDLYQNRAAELMKQVKVLQNKLKKAGIE